MKNLSSKNSNKKESNSKEGVITFKYLLLIFPIFIMLLLLIFIFKNIGKNETRLQKKNFFYNITIAEMIKKRHLCARNHKIKNLEEPETFRDKIHWLLLNDFTRVKTLLSDKLIVNKYVEKAFGKQYVNKIYGIWNDFDEINFDELPNKFILKCNHGSSMNYKVPDKTKFDKKEARKKFKEWLAYDYSENCYEMNYEDLNKKIFAEEYLDEIMDYKALFFNGNPLLVVQINDLKGKLYQKRWYNDKQLEILSRYRNSSNDDLFYFTEEYMKVLNMSKNVAKYFPFVRIDFYKYKKDQWRFSEFTFYPNCGNESDEFSDEYDYFYGHILKLPKKYFVTCFQCSIDYDKMQVELQEDILKKVGKDNINNL